MLSTSKLSEKSSKGPIATIALIGMSVLGPYLYSPLPAAAQGAAIGPLPTEGQCESYASAYGRGNLSDVFKLKQCCDRVFADAASNAKAETISGSLQFLAAAKGRMVCIDQFKLSRDPQVKPKFVRRNVIAGLNPGLSHVSALAFADSARGPGLAVSDENGSASQLLIFNYLMDGNIKPDRELRVKGLPSTVAMTTDSRSNQLILLGSDGVLRLMSLTYNDRSLNPAEHAKIDQQIESASSIAQPLAVAYSPKMRRILVLTDDRKIHLFFRDQQGKTELEAPIAVTDLENPIRISTIESDASDTVMIEVQGADGAHSELKVEVKTEKSGI